MQLPTKILLILFFCSLSNKVLAYQSDNQQSDNLLAVGYQYSFSEPNQKRFHLIDINYQKSFSSGRHGGSLNWYIGNEFALNTSKFLIGPKIGGYFNFGGFVLGSQLVYYTNFQNNSIRYVPYLGIGSSSFRLTINPNIRLTNKDFEPINRGSVQLVFGINL